MTKNGKTKGKFTVGFSGHRDKVADWFELKDIMDWYGRDKSLVVVHGGAVGFDTQVHRVVQRLNSKKYKGNIEEIIIKPDYLNIENKKFAPLKRNEEIVKLSDVIVALYDGRKKGGTKYTIDHATVKNVDVYYLNPKEIK